MPAADQLPEVIDYIETSLGALSAQEKEIATYKQANEALTQRNAALTQECESLKQQKTASAGGLPTEQVEQIISGMKQAGMLDAESETTTRSCLAQDTKYAAKLISRLIPLVPAQLHTEPGALVSRNRTAPDGRSVADRWIA